MAAATVVLTATTAAALAGSIWLWFRSRRLRSEVVAVAEVLDPEGSVSQGSSPAARLRAVADHARTELARAAASRASLRQGLDAVDLGIVICDRSGEITYANSGAQAFSGRQHGDALVEAAVDEVLAAALGGEPAERTLDLFKPPRRTLVISAAPFGENPDSGGGIAIIEDVSERRRLEAARRDFVSNIGHELKTPVGALALLAETVQAEDDPAVASRLAHRMQTEADRVGRTIDDLLTLSRIESGEASEREVVAVDRLVGEAVARIRPAAEQREIEVRVTPPNHGLAVSGDRRQLVSALYNLLDNAVKYSEPRDVVELSCTTDGQTVSIDVSDEGIGIPKRDLERIFERFYRVDQARSRQTGGTGLGLSIVHHVASNHGGSIEVDSRAGEGSTFTLTLPASGEVVSISEAV